MCVWDVFPLCLLCSLARSLQCISKGSFCVPACRRLLTWQFHNVPPKMRGSLSLTQSYAVRSQQLRNGRPFWCVRVSERACQTERVERARAVSERRRSGAAKMKKGLSVASTFTSFQLLSCAWSFCLVLVCARQIATRAVCWPKKITYTQHIKQQQQQQPTLKPHKKENYFSLCINE